MRGVLKRANLKTVENVGVKERLFMTLLELDNLRSPAVYKMEMYSKMF